MDHAVEQRMAVGLSQDRVADVDRRRDAGLVLRLEPAAQAGVDIGSADQRIVRDIPIQWVLGRCGAGEPERRQGR